MFLKKIDQKIYDFLNFLISDKCYTAFDEMTLCFLLQNMSFISKLHLKTGHIYIDPVSGKITAPSILS